MPSPRPRSRGSASLDLAAPDATLDADWLTVVASVRPRMAWIETLQLQALPFPDHAAMPFPGFEFLEQDPGDPWLVEALACVPESNVAWSLVATIRDW